MNALTRQPGINAVMAQRYSMDPDKFSQVIKTTVMPGNATPEQTAAMLMVAHEYGLNPLLKQIYAFPSRGGGITPMISIDGWCELLNRQPQYDGVEFEDHTDDEGAVYAITCTMHRKDRGHPTVVTEYLDECKRTTEPWKQSPKRMLRHRALIQAARYSFGLSGAFDPDHAETIDAAPVDIDYEPIERTVTPKRVPPPAPAKAKAKEPVDKPVEQHDPETGEVFGPEQFLTDLDEHLAQAGDLEQLDLIWSDFDVLATLAKHPEHQARAEGFLDWHEGRIAKIKK